MQTISLEDEIKLIDGVAYDINFFQNFSARRIDGCPIEDIPVIDIIESILNPKTETVICAAYDNTPSWESYQRSQRLWEAVDKHNKEERKREKKWKKGRKKRHERAKRFMKEIDKW